MSVLKERYRGTSLTIDQHLGNSLGGLVVIIYPNVWYTVYLPTTTTLPETNIFAPDNGWLEDDELSFLGRLGLFSGAKMLVSGSVIYT